MDDQKRALSEDEIRNLAGTVSADDINSQLMSGMKGTFLTTLGLGAGVRGAQGLYNLVRRNLNPIKSPSESMVIGVPTDRKTEKLAHVKEAVPEWMSDPSKYFQDMFAGRNVESLVQYPLAGAGLATAGMAGIYGGYKGMDALLDSRRRFELSSEEDEAKQKYHTALQQLVQRPSMPGMKQSSEDETTLSEDLDRLYEHVKQGFDYGGAALNLAGLTWPLSAAVGGYAAYNLTKGRQQSRTLQKALSRRQRQQVMGDPLYAFPEYQPAASPEDDIDEPKPHVQEALTPGLSARAA